MAQKIQEIYDLIDTFKAAIASAPELPSNWAQKVPLLPKDSDAVVIALTAYWRILAWEPPENSGLVFDANGWCWDEKAAPKGVLLDARMTAWSKQDNTVRTVRERHGFWKGLYPTPGNTIIWRPIADPIQTEG